jgi:peptidoglycan/LPS O-acetylase OafA/YrhL
MHEAVMKLSNVQALRACAALMIVVFHCGIETERLSALTGGGKLFREQAWGEGVPIFFAISGFIMVVTSASAFGSFAAAVDFMRRRIIRIVPLYWTVTTMALVALLIAPGLMTKTPPGDHAYIVSSYLFFPYLRLDGEIRPLAAMGWTLNLEMLFYTIFAACLVLRYSRAIIALFATLGLLVAARVAGLLPGTALNFWGDPIVLDFLAGAAVGIAFNSGWRVSGITALALATAGFALIFLCWIPEGEQSELPRRLAEAAPAIIIFVAAALGPQIDDKWKLWRGALAIGDASYSLYLWNPFALMLLYVLWHRAPFTLLPLWTFIPVGIAVAVASSLVSYRYFEKPVTRWLSGRKAARVPAGLGAAQPA